MDYAKKLRRFFLRTNMSKHKFCDISGFSKEQLYKLMCNTQIITTEYKLQLDEFFSDENNWVWNEKQPNKNVKRDLEKGVRTCSKCKEIKSFLRVCDMGRVYHIDNKSLRWNGYTCYQCFKSQCRNRYRTKMKLPKERLRKTA